MFCGNCGAENANGAKFCKGCGKPLGNASNNGIKITPHNGDNPSIPKIEASQTVDKLKVFPKKAIIGICSAIVVLIIIICVAANSGKTINLNKYLMIETEGYDGYGTANVKIDWDAIQAKYGSKVKFNTAIKKEFGNFIDMATPIDVIKECVSVNLDESNNLKNGQVINYTWDVDEDLSKYVKCKIKYTDDKYNVSGLKEVGTFDAFKDLTVEFTGIAPNGYANLNYTGSEIDYYDFTCDKVNGLSNGDTIKVTINNSKLEYYAENLGKVPAELEKEYKVNGLKSYLTKTSEIDAEALAQMQQQASDVYNAYVANWDEGSTLESLTYIGNYLLTAKDSDTWGIHNYLYLVYKAQVRNIYSNDGKTYNKLNDDYWFICFEDLMVDSDGKVSIDVTKYNTPNDRFSIDSGINSGWWSTMSWYYEGYNTLDELYKKVVTSNMAAYNYEDNVDESVAPETVVSDESEIIENGFVLPDSATKVLSRDDLEGLSAEECKIARNEIYARHGRKFQDAELQAYFDACDWYEGKIDPDDFQESSLSDIEIKNKDLIVSYEEEMGYR